MLGAVVVGGVAVGAWLIGNTGDPPLPLTDRPVIVDKPRPGARLTSADRRAILAVGRTFVATAVMRVHPERAWPLTTPAMRSGTTLADWKAGTLPIPPFPVRKARWALAYSVVGEVGLDVLVESTDPEVRPLLHRLTLVRNPGRVTRQWLVDSWTPMGSPAGGFDNRPVLGSAAAGSQQPVRSTPRPGRLWILAPFVVILAALMIPLVLAVGSRRAERRSRRRRESSRV